MNFLLEADGNVWAENLKNGLPIFLTGMLTVFAVLGIIWCCLLIFKYVFYDVANSGKKTREKKIVVEEVAKSAVAYSSDDEIVAVIAAAIAMAESESVGAKFKVVSFRRK